MISVVLGWMLFNVWLTLIMLELNREFVAGWGDLGMLFLCSVISPITLIIVYWVIHKIKRWRR